MFKITYEHQLLPAFLSTMRKGDLVFGFSLVCLCLDAVISGFDSILNYKCKELEEKAQLYIKIQIDLN